MNQELKIVLTLLLIFAVFLGYPSYLVDNLYDTKIETAGEESIDIAMNGEQNKQFAYNQIAFNTLRKRQFESFISIEKFHYEWNRCLIIIERKRKKVVFL